MRKIFFILLCSFVCFGFSTEKTKLVSVDKKTPINTINDVETYSFSNENGTMSIAILNNGICEQGVVNGIIETDCDSDGSPEYSWSGTICREHMQALIDYFVDAC